MPVLVDSRTANKEEWETPDILFEKLNSMFHFDLDPCATRKNAKCPDFFTKAQDGLLQNWSASGHRSAFVNPPYSRGVVAEWLRKAKTERDRGVRSVLLVPSDPSTLWWWRYAIRADVIYHLTPRVRFVGGPSSPPFASAALLFDPQLKGLIKGPITYYWNWKKARLVGR